MGFMDIFSREARKQSALERNTKKVVHRHLQSADRYAAMEQLRADGSEAALLAVARRFSFNYDKTIEDEQEKNWVFDVLTSLGERAIPPVRRYALDAVSLAWPLRVLEKIAEPARMAELVDELLAREEPGYTRDPARKLQILSWLADWNGSSPSELARRVVPYLGDFDEGVRFLAADTLAHSTTRDESIALAPLLDALLRPEEDSRRVKLRVGEVLAEAGWRVTARLTEVSALLASTLPEFTLSDDRLVRRKA